MGWQICLLTKDEWTYFTHLLPDDSPSRRWRLAACREEDCVKSIAKAIGGDWEIKLCSGLADIVTKTHVYEVDDVSQWKQAIGQALVYAGEIGKRPGIVLFGRTRDANGKELAIIRDAAQRLKICVLLLFPFYVYEPTLRALVYPLKGASCQQCQNLCDVPQEWGITYEELVAWLDEFMSVPRKMGRIAMEYEDKNGIFAFRVNTWLGYRPRHLRH